MLSFFWRCVVGLSVRFFVWIRVLRRVRVRELSSVSVSARIRGSFLNCDMIYCRSSSSNSNSV